jgi:hypothetical protein
LCFAASSKSSNLNSGAEGVLQVCPNLFDARDHVVGPVKVLGWEFVDGVVDVLLRIWEIKR